MNRLQCSLLACAMLVLGSHSTAGVLKVHPEAGGAGNGSTWADAYTTIGAAVAAATAGDEIWIAAGAYVYPVGTQVLISKNLSLYGGFAGASEAETIAGRDVDANQTILSGDGDDDDVWMHYFPLFETFAETNVTTTLRPIVGGKVNIPMDFDNTHDYYALAPDNDNGGQKMVEVASGITAVIDGLWLVAANFRGNGMGALHYNSAGAGSVVRNVRFVGCYNNTHNTATLHHGGGQKLIIDSCSFYYLRNPAGHGAAVYQNVAQEAIVNCSFVGISAAICGSIIESRGGKLWMTNNVAARCVSTHGWGNGSYGAQCLLLSQGGNDAVVIHSLVMTNCGSIVTSATSVGTAIPLLRRNANYSVEECYFGGNKMSFAIPPFRTYSMFMADDYAGESTAAPGEFKNVTFERNVVRTRPLVGAFGKSAVGIVGTPHSAQTLVNCTFIDNEAYGFDGDLVCYASKGVVASSLALPNYNALGVANCTFIGDNRAPDVVVVDPANDNYVNLVNCLFKNTEDDDVNDAIQVAGDAAAHPVNVIHCSINGMDVVPAGLAVAGLEIDPILLEREDKLVAAGAIPVYRAASASGGVTNAADVATLANANGYGYKLPGAEAVWQRLTQIGSGTDTNAPITDAFGAARPFGGFTRGAVQNLTPAAAAGNTLVVRKVTRFAGDVSPAVQVFTASEGIADISATPDTTENEEVAFTGWYRDGACSDAISTANPLTSADFPVSTSAVIYAKFAVPEVSITFNLGDYATFPDETSSQTLSLVPGSVLEVPFFTMKDEYFSEGFEDLPAYVPFASASYTLRAVSRSLRVVRVVPTADVPEGSDLSGDSWANATDDLQAAIVEASRYRGEVWVKAGRYVPPTTGYILKSNVALVGGFAGTETSRDQADPDANATCFSGDKNDDSYWSRLNSKRNGWEGITPRTNVWYDGVFNFSDELLDRYTAMVPNGNIGDNIYRAFLVNGATNTAFRGITFTLFRTAVIDDSVGNGGRIAIDGCKFLANNVDNNAGYEAISLAKSGTWIEVRDSSFAGNARCVDIAWQATLNATNTFQNVVFTGNTGASGGCCINLTGSGVNILGEACAFNRNICTSGSDGIQFNCGGSGDIARLRNCSFTGNASFGNTSGLLFFGNGMTIAGPDKAFRVENCTFTGNTYDSVAANDANPHSAVIVRTHNNIVQIDGCYFADNEAIVTNGLLAATCGTIASASNNGGELLFVNCTFERSAASQVSLDPASLVKTGTFATHGVGKLGLVHCIVTDSVLAGGVPEFVIRNQSLGNTFSLANTIARNASGNYNPIELVSPGSGYVPSLMNAAVSQLDVAGLGWGNTADTVITNVSGATAELSSRLAVSPDGTVRMRGLSQSSPFAKAGRSVYRHAANGRYYVHLPELSAANPWRCVSDVQSTLSAASIDGAAEMPIADAFGDARLHGKIAYGPLNAAPASTLFLLR